MLPIQQIGYFAFLTLTAMNDNRTEYMDHITAVEIAEIQFLLHGQGEKITCGYS